MNKKTRMNFLSNLIGLKNMSLFQASSTLEFYERTGERRGVHFQQDRRSSGLNVYL
jgi:hypothetical protein